jgi:CBS domain-containing protein
MLRKKLKDLMIPLDRYSTVHPEATLKEAVQGLRQSYCQLETGICTEAGPRSVLVVDRQNQLVGMLDFRSILKVLIPEVAGGLTKRLEALGATIAFAESSYSSFDEAAGGFNARVLQNAQVKVKDIMLKVRGKIDVGAGLIDALKLIFRNNITKIPVYEGDKLIGIVRDTDLFLAVADAVSETP